METEDGNLSAPRLRLASPASRHTRLVCGCAFTGTAADLPCMLAYPYIKPSTSNLLPVAVLFRCHSYIYDRLQPSSIRFHHITFSDLEVQYRRNNGRLD